MSGLSQPVFTFAVDGQPDDTFDVVRFSGDEGISRLYAFDVLLASDSMDLDPADMLQGTAHLNILPPFASDGGLTYTGILSRFDVLHRMGARYIYRARLQHSLWWLSLVRQNRVFVNKTPIEACTQLLNDADLHGGAFRWKCQKTYPSREFICQYGESDYDFLCRWLERLGIYFWFEQTDSGPCCVFGDSAMIHTPLPGNESCVFSEPTGLNADNPGRVITDFTLSCPPLPKKVCFKSYNPLKPDLDLSSTASVAARGRGVFYRYGGSCTTKSEAGELAATEAQALLCTAGVFSGQSHNPALRPGHTFTLDRHFRPAWNQMYLTTGVRHEGSQARLVARTLGGAGGALGDADRLFYRNSFTCIPASTQYRAPRRTPWPSLAGFFPGKVDGEGSEEVAQLDSQGRYKIILPFDRAQRGGGKASCWVRMMQPYAGAGMGFHAPLHKGTEVLVAFLNGDPDQPVIAGAVPNPATPSVTNDANATCINLVGSSGQSFVMDDKEGATSITLFSADRKSFIRLGQQ